MDKRIYVFEDVRVDPTAHRVEKGGVERALEPKAFAVLEVLMAHAGELVSRDALLDAVWGHRHVTTSVLNRVIVQLRRALEDDRSHPRFIATVHGLGYRFTAPITVLSLPVLDEGARSAPVVGAAPRQRARIIALALIAFALAAVAVFTRHREPAVAGEASVSLVVLPFTATGTDPDLAAAAEGLSESLTDALARSGGVRVTGRETAHADDIRGASPLQAAGRLGVDFALQGSVRAAAGVVEVDAVLWRRGVGEPVWQRTYSQPRTQLFQILMPIAGEVYASVLPQRHHDTAALAASVPAQDLYWLGRRYWYERTPASLARALEYFNRSLLADPGYALAHTGIADTNMLMYEYGDLPLEDASARAREAIARAKAMAPDLPDALASEGLLLLDEGDMQGAVVVLGRALKLEPGLQNARLWYGDALAYSGQVARAREWHAAAAREDPLNPVLQTYLGVDAMLAGDEAAATAYFRRAIEIKRDYSEPYWQLALQHELYGRLEQARAVYAEPGTVGGHWTGLYHSYVDLLAGDGAAAERLLGGTLDLPLSDRIDALCWALWLQGRMPAAREVLEKLQPGPVGTRYRDAVRARVALFDGRDEEARQRYDGIFVEITGGDPFLRPWLPDLGLGHFAAWIGLMPESPRRDEAIAAYAAQLDGFLRDGMRVPPLTYQRAVLEALRGDAVAAEKRLSQAQDEGWLDVSALRRDPAWRTFESTAWYARAQRRLDERVRAQAEAPR